MSKLTEFKRLVRAIRAFGFPAIMFEAGTVDSSDLYLGIQLVNITDLYELGKLIGPDGPCLGVTIFDYQKNVLWMPSKRLDADQYQWMLDNDNSSMHS